MVVDIADNVPNVTGFSTLRHGVTIASATAVSAIVCVFLAHPTKVRC